MDRQAVIDWFNQYLLKGLQDEEVCVILTSYCEERGKNIIDVQTKLIPFLLTHREYIPQCLNNAFEYWRRLHQIYILYKNPGPLDANKRQVVLIY